MRQALWKPKKGDLLAAALVLVLAAVSAMALPGLRSGGTYARILQDGVTVREIPLSVDQTFEIRGDYTNTVTVLNGRIAVTCSDCPNQDCVHMGWLQDGGAIVCLPNGVEIRLIGDTDVDLVVR